MLSKAPATADQALELARELVHGVRMGSSPICLIGEFVIPPPDGSPTRDFQTLHFDFGMPVDPKVGQHVARCTALYIPPEVTGVSAVTRLVPVCALLQQRTWPSRGELIGRLKAYGRTHGAWDDARGYTEGSLARIVEAAAALPPALPSVKTETSFLCGTEFDSLRAELAFFQLHGLDVLDVQIEVGLRPGELLIFDNIALAHGRRGSRQPGELHQWVFGRRLSPDDQREVRDVLLAAFERRRSGVESIAGHGVEPVPRRESSASLLRLVGSRSDDERHETEKDLEA